MPWAGRLCLVCGERRARFSYRGVVKADRDHTLCFECYRAEANRYRMSWLGTRSVPVPAGDPPPMPSGRAADRAALLDELRARRRRAQITARHALDTADVVLAAEPLAS